MFSFSKMADTGGNYSILEAVHPIKQPIQTRKPCLVDSGKQVVPESGKQATQTYNNGIEVVSKSGYPQQDSAYDAYPRKSRGKWIVIGGVVALVVILAAVLGGVLGSRSKSKSGVPSSTPSSTPSSSPVSAQYQGNIAAVSFILNNTNRTKVYYQDGNGQLMEAADSADGTWTNTQLGYVAMNGSPLAAAVSRYAPLACSNHFLIAPDLLTNSRKLAFTIRTPNLSSMMLFTIRLPTSGLKVWYRDRNILPVQTQVWRRCIISAPYAATPPPWHTRI